MDIGDLFSFDKMVAPSIVKPLYWILMIVIILIGGWTFLRSFFWFADSGIDFWDGVAGMIGAVVWTAVMIPILRIGAESALALFEIREKLKGGDAPQQVL
jgi:membrane associated rhomboid family serine protease